MKIIKGMILVCIKNQKTGCGILYVIRDSIIKAAEDSSNGWNWFEIYRNKTEEENDKVHNMNIRNVRLATADEVKAWDNGLHYISQMKVTEDAESE